MIAPDLARHVGRWYGKHAGIVTDNENPNGLGWITVQVPSLYPDGETLVARPSFSAGRFWVPPIDALVWVEFEAGDPTSPLWTGVWFTTNDLPPEADVAPPTSHVLTTPGGHVVELADGAGDERISIGHSGGASVVLDSDGSITITAQNEATTIVLDASGKVTIDANELEVNALATTISGSAEVGGPAAQEVLLKTFLDFYRAHTHATAVGPSGPPIPPVVDAAVISAKLKAAIA